MNAPNFRDVDVNPYQSPNDIVRAELVKPLPQPWSPTQRLIFWICVVMFGPGALAGLLMVVFALVMAILQRAGWIAPLES